MMSIYYVSTTQGKISVLDTNGSGLPVLFLHGNSACKEVFSRQFESSLTKKYRFIGLDFLGHGDSEKAKDPEKAYNIEGYAQIVIEVIDKLKFSRLAIVGWSLGGHVGIQLLRKCQKIAGLVIMGTPPIKICPEGFQEGFLPLPLFATLFKKIEFTKEEAVEFMKDTGIDLEKSPFIVEAALKTDGYARLHLANSLETGVGGNQKEIVETNDTPLCVVVGEKDTGINNKYIMEKVKYKNLFNQVYVIKNAHHAVFWEKPDEFNQILELFLASLGGYND